MPGSILHTFTCALPPVTSLNGSFLRNAPHLAVSRAALTQTFGSAVGISHRHILLSSRAPIVKRIESSQLNPTARTPLTCWFRILRGFGGSAFARGRRMRSQASSRSHNTAGEATPSGASCPVHNTLPSFDAATHVTSSVCPLKKQTPSRLVACWTTTMPPKGYATKASSSTSTATRPFGTVPLNPKQAVGSSVVMLSWGILCVFACLCVYRLPV